MKKLLVGLIAAFALFVSVAVASAHTTGSYSGRVEGSAGFPGFPETVSGFGMYSGHGHARACIDVMLQEETSQNGQYADVGNPAQSCEQPADGNLSAVSRDQCQDITGFYRTYRVRIRFRTWGPAGTPTGDVTKFKGQNRIVSADCFF